jgi:hypothetical protein
VCDNKTISMGFTLSHRFHAADDKGPCECGSLESIDNNHFFQVFCGIEKPCSPSLKVKHQKKLLNEISIKATSEALNLAQKKEIASRISWISQCINAAQLGEVNICFLLSHACPIAFSVAQNIS